MLRLTLLCLLGLTCSHAVSADLGSEAILGGEYAREGDFKYQIFLHFRHHCGGAIIADQYVLTAAHCVTDKQGQIKHEPFIVIAGTHDIKHTYHEFNVHVDTVYVHKDFVRNYVHDFAVLKLHRKLNLAAHPNKIQKVDLPKPGRNYENAYAVVAGFGYQEVKVKQDSNGRWHEYDGKADGKLKFANVRVISNEKCAQMNVGQVIYPTFLCGQVEQRKKHHHYEGTCNGDSGSPLVYGNEVIGILTGSPFACNETGMAGTYQRVTSYVHIIESIINGKPGSEVRHAKVPLH